MSDVLTELAAILEQRKQESADSSYVASLYAKGYLLRCAFSVKPDKPKRRCNSFKTSSGLNP
jgi:hypothetical protein